MCLALKFSEELPQMMTVLAYAEFDNVIELDHNRFVLVDYGRRMLRIFRKYDDVYSVNTLPPHRNRLLVCNLDPSHCPGSHRVVIYVDSDDGYKDYFNLIRRAPPDVV